MVPELDTPVWVTAGSTVAGYLIILAILTLVLFGIPYLIFLIL